MLPEILGVSTYGIMAAAGFTAFFLIFVLMLSRKHNVPFNELSNVIFLLFASIGLGLLLAAILDALFKIPDRGRFEFGGITWYGMMLGGFSGFALFYWLFARKIKPSADKLKIETPLTTYLNVGALGMSLGHGLGRIGCFLAGCCYGGPTNSFLGVVFPEGSLAYREYGVGVAVWPVQLFEALGLFCIFAFLLLVKHKRIQDNRLYIYLAAYAVLRFLLEFLRGDFRGGLFGAASPAQFLSIGILLFVGVMLLRRYICNKKAGAAWHAPE